MVPISVIRHLNSADSAWCFTSNVLNYFLISLSVATTSFLRHASVVTVLSWRLVSMAANLSSCSFIFALSFHKPLSRLCNHLLLLLVCPLARLLQIFMLLELLCKCQPPNMDAEIIELSPAVGAHGPLASIRLALPRTPNRPLRASRRAVDTS